MSRIPYPEVGSLSAAKRAVLDDPGVRTLNVSRMNMHAPERLWAAQRALGVICSRGQVLEPRLRELVILQVGYLLDCGYELHHHRSIAGGLGVGEDAFEALRTGDYCALSPVEQAVCRFVAALVRDVRPTDETLAAVRGLISDEAMFEVIFLAGYYMTLARVIAVAGPELDDEPVRGWG